MIPCYDDLHITHDLFQASTAKEDAPAALVTITASCDNSNLMHLQRFFR
jgi:hypothetical protein